MHTNESMQWLYEFGGPVIRLKTARELMVPGSTDIAALEQALLDDPCVKTWLDHLDPERVTLRTYHGSSDTCFENSISMLVQLGLKAGMAVLDEKTLPLRLWLKHAMSEDKDRWDVFAMAVFAALLAYAGYRDDAILAFLRLRLQTLAAFARQRNYDLYADPAAFRGVPTAFKNRPILRPGLYPGGDYQYPIIYDLYGLAALAQETDAQTKSDMEAVVRYILAPEYQQKIADGYGILAAPGGKYHSMGWDCKLPCYEDICEDAKEKAPLLIQRALLFSKLPGTDGHPWLTSVLKHLNGFMTDRGTWLFPRHYLKESPGYFVSGMHMGLGENRRNKNALELTSTFYMLALAKQTDMR